jgi:hypothetical protein
VWGVEPSTLEEGTELGLVGSLLWRWVLFFFLCGEKNNNNYMTERTETVTFALLVVRHPLYMNRFALVNESKDRGWWLPGGG